MAQELKRIFSELKDGPIDLNGNNKPDQDDELDEMIPESGIKDSLIQGQEILDFIIANYKFLPMDKLLDVQKALPGARGVIPELISLNYASRIENIIHIKGGTRFPRPLSDTFCQAGSDQPD